MVAPAQQEPGLTLAESRPFRIQLQPKEGLSGRCLWPAIGAQHAIIFARGSWKRIGLRLEERRIERMADLVPAGALQASRDDCPFIPRILPTDIKDIVGGGVSSSDDSGYLVTLATYRRPTGERTFLWSPLHHKTRSGPGRLLSSCTSGSTSFNRRLLNSVSIGGRGPCAVLSRNRNHPTNYRRGSGAILRRTTGWCSKNRCTRIPLVRWLDLVTRNSD